MAAADGPNGGERMRGDDSGVDSGAEAAAREAAASGDITAVSASGAAPAAPTARVEPLPLEWTQMGTEEHPSDRLAYPWDVIPAEDLQQVTTTQELMAVGTHGRKITRMGMELSDRYPNLTRLVLRSHLIRKVEGIRGLTKLELLELYDNQIEKLECLDGDGGEGDDANPGPGAALITLDMSYNVVRDMRPVCHCPNLVELYLAQNKLKEIRGLSGLKKLKKIDLGANRIRTMPGEELGGLESLEELWLGKNKIEKIEGLEKLTKLRRLDVQANRLTAIANLTSQVDTLEELYLAHNGIDDDGASDAETGLGLPFSRLDTLDLSRNRLTTTKPFAHLTSLEELWLSGNKIEKFEDVEHISCLGGGGGEGEGGGGGGLNGIYLEMNPVADEFGYRKRLAEMIPSLTQIDADAIGGPTAAMSAMSLGGMVLGHSGGGAGMESPEVRMRRMQELAITRAREQQRQREEQEEEEEKSGGEES